MEDNPHKDLLTQGSSNKDVAINGVSECGKFPLPLHLKWDWLRNIFALFKTWIILTGLIRDGRNDKSGVGYDIFFVIVTDMLSDIQACI